MPVARYGFQHIEYSWNCIRLRHRPDRPGGLRCSANRHIPSRRFLRSVDGHQPNIGRQPVKAEQSTAVNDDGELWCQQKRCLEPCDRLAQACGQRARISYLMRVNI